MKEWLLNRIKKAGENIESTLTQIFFVALFGGPTAILALSKKARDFALQLADTQTPLWATILLVLLCCLYIYLKVRKPNPSFSHQNPIIEPQQVKYCECCPIGERQPLTRTGGTSKRDFYVCPKTKQSYSFPKC